MTEKYFTEHYPDIANLSFSVRYCLPLGEAEYFYGKLAESYNAGRASMSAEKDREYVAERLRAQKEELSRARKRTRHSLPLNVLKGFIRGFINVLSSLWHKLD